MARTSARRQPVLPTKNTRMTNPNQFLNGNHANSDTSDCRGGGGGQPELESGKHGAIVNGDTVDTVVLHDEERVFGRGCGLLAPTRKRTISYFAREYCT